jgi:hypothetical protein
MPREEIYHPNVRDLTGGPYKALPPPDRGADDATPAEEESVPGIHLGPEVHVGSYLHLFVPIWKARVQQRALEGLCCPLGMHWNCGTVEEDVEVVLVAATKVEVVLATEVEVVDATEVEVDDEVLVLVVGVMVVEVVPPATENSCIPLSQATPCARAVP